MKRIDDEGLRRATLARQFPAVDGRDPAAVLELFGRLGPIQSQVPRSPFLTASSRLPGVTYATMAALFEDHRLLKTSSLRGTVHTTDRAQYPLVDAVARRQRAQQLTRALELPDPGLAHDLARATEAFADGTWRPRAEIIAWARDWLEQHAGPDSAATVGTTFTDALLWGHSAMIRRPKDGRWERRTDSWHRRTRELVPELPELDVDAALAGLVRVHLGSYGPAQRADLAYFCGVGLTVVDQAVAALGDEVIKLDGPGGVYLDLATPPVGGPDPGLRLLPEFDGLLLGFHGRNRFRFLDEHQLPHVWAKVNGVYSPIVLHDGRIVATWRTVTQGPRTRLEVSMLDPHPPLPDDAFTDAIQAIEQVLDLTISELRVDPAD